MLPPLTKDTLSANAVAPPTEILPESDAPNTIALKPFLNTEVPVNQLDANDNVPVPVPKPMVVFAANGSMAKVPVPNTWLVPLPVNESLLPRSVMRPL